MTLTRRDTLTGAAGAIAAATCPVSASVAAVTGEVYQEALLGELERLVAELCRACDESGCSSAVVVATKMLVPLLERRGHVAICRYLANDAIEAIQVLHRPDEDFNADLRPWAVQVGTRLKWATGAVKPPMRDGPDGSV